VHAGDGVHLTQIGGYHEHSKTGAQGRHTLQAAQALSSGTGAPRAAASPGVIEVELGQVRLRLRGCVDEASLRCLVRALREAA
jgi:hypothetical protein